MRRAIRDHLGNFIPLVGLFLIALVVSGYILHHQRLRFPFIEAKPFQLDAELADAKSVIPGQGQTIRVSGVRIGDVSGVHLKDGHAVVSLEIDPKFRDLIHTDATVLLRPKTGLEDMFLELNPGSRSAPLVGSGDTIPIGSTLPPVNTDQILASLDGDTRAYLDLLVNGAGHGLRGRGDDLREVFRRFGPTHRDLARFATAVAARRHNLRRLIHSLQLLNTAVATRAPQLTELVSSSAGVLRAFASEDRNVSRTVADLPGALAQTTDTLDRLRRYAGVLGPAADRLRSPFRHLPAANDALARLGRETEPILRERVRPFVREARPLVRDLRPAARGLAAATPDLTGSFVVLNHLLNTVAFNPKGREGPGVPGRLEGFLFWIAWLNHQTVNLFSTADAHGTFRPVTLGASCQTFQTLVAQQPQLEFLLNLTPLLTSSSACGIAPNKLPRLDVGRSARRGGP